MTGASGGAQQFHPILRQDARLGQKPDVPVTLNDGQVPLPGVFKFFQHGVQAFVRGDHRQGPRHDVFYDDLVVQLVVEHHLLHTVQ